MKKELFFCDRCGKEITKEWLDTKGFHIHAKHFLTTNYEEHLLLCQDCYDGLDEWWKKGKEKI